MPAQLVDQRLCRQRALRQQGEYAAFDGGQDEAGAPERHPLLDDVLWIDELPQHRADQRVLEGAHHQTLAPDIDRGLFSCHVRYLHVGRQCQRCVTGYQHCREAEHPAVRN
jgi:hypothetical protein